MRAVSSPSLTDALQEELNHASVGAAATSAVFNTHTPDSGASGESTPTMVTATINNQSSNNNSSGLLGSLPSSQSVGVLQKFKRTLTNFNKPAQQQQQQQPPQHITSSNSTQALVMTTSTSTTSASLAGGANGVGINAIVGENQSDATANVALEGTAGKYRFGPLIWRSSKERRKTKYNRRDKCNSGDSGIQIELDNDEQFSRIMLPANCIGSGGGVGGVSATRTSASATAASAQANANAKVSVNSVWLLLAGTFR